MKNVKLQTWFSFCYVLFHCHLSLSFAFLSIPYLIRSWNFFTWIVFPFGPHLTFTSYTYIQYIHIRVSQCIDTVYFLHLRNQKIYNQWNSCGSPLDWSYGVLPCHAHAYTYTLDRYKMLCHLILRFIRLNVIISFSLTNNNSLACYWSMVFFS